MKKELTTKEISSILGVSVSLVYRKLKKHSIEPVNPDEVQRFKAQKLYSSTVLDVLRPQQNDNSVTPNKKEDSVLKSTPEGYIKESEHYKIILEDRKQRIAELQQEINDTKEILQTQSVYTNQLLSEQQNTIQELNETNQRNQALLLQQMEANKKLQERVNLLEQKPRKKFLGLF